MRICPSCHITASCPYCHRHEDTPRPICPRCHGRGEIDTDEPLRRAIRAAIKNGEWWLSEWQAGRARGAAEIVVHDILRSLRAVEGL